MLVTTTAGNVYRINSAGAVSLLASVGEDTEGMDFATAAWGSFAGDVLVGSESSGTLRAISPTGAITVIAHVSGAETISFVPLNLGASGNPLEGFYAADYPVQIIKADDSQFTGMLGDAIITDEFGHGVYDVHYNGTSFIVSSIGSFPNQPEDGIFVTADRINPPAAAPEPASLGLMFTGLAAIGEALRRRLLHK